MPNNCIFYAEDDPNDVFFLQHAFTAANIANPLQTVSDGQAAIDYFAGTGAFAGRQKFPLPCLVLLDLKLPHKTGLEVLAWLRAHPQLRFLPVIMFTASAQPSDIEQACVLGANAFVVKPVTMEDRRDFVECLQSFWLRFHRCPASWQ